MSFDNTHEYCMAVESETLPIHCLCGHHGLIDGVVELHPGPNEPQWSALRCGGQTST